MKASLSRGRPGKLSDEFQSMRLVNWKLLKKSIKHKF